MIRPRSWIPKLTAGDRYRIEAALSAVRPVAAPKVAGLFENQKPARRRRAGRLSVAGRMARRFAARVQ